MCKAMILNERRMRLRYLWILLTSIGIGWLACARFGEMERRRVSIQRAAKLLAMWKLPPMQEWKATEYEPGPREMNVFQRSRSAEAVYLDWGQGRTAVISAPDASIARFPVLEIGQKNLVLPLDKNCASLLRRHYFGDVEAVQATVLEGPWRPFSSTGDFERTEVVVQFVRGDLTVIRAVFDCATGQITAYSARKE